MQLKESLQSSYCCPLPANAWALQDQSFLCSEAQPLVWLLQDFQEGAGERPQDGQEVTFSYVAYNESGAKIDSSYQKGRPASTRLGINGLIPGEERCAFQGHIGQ